MLSFDGSAFIDNLVVNNEVNNALITREVNKKDSGGESRHFHGLWKYRTFWTLYMYMAQVEPAV